MKRQGRQSLLGRVSSEDDIAGYHLPVFAYFAPWLTNILLKKQATSRKEQKKRNGCQMIFNDWQVKQGVDGKMVEIKKR